VGFGKEWALGERGGGGDPARMVYHSNSMLARLAAVREGLGISWLSSFSAKKHKSLVRVPVDSEPVEGDLCLIVHVDLRRNARVRAFLDFVHEYLVEHRERLY
jgi:DNA-binding transcriptional LysR family regulator